MHYDKAGIIIDIEINTESWYVHSSSEQCFKGISTEQYHAVKFKDHFK